MFFKMYIAAFELFIVIALLFCVSNAKLKDGECEVCISMIKQISDAVNEAKVSKPEEIETVIKQLCKKTKSKEEQFCYYVGGLETSATKILQSISKPLSYYVPPEKICEKLKPMDGQICELQYEKQIDLDAVDLSKLKVKELRKILDSWGASCKGCTEKSEFVRLINELRPTHYKPPKKEL